MNRARTLAALLALGPCLAPAAVAGEPGAELPDSLGQWYKPANKRQVWLHTMFAMRRELQAVRDYAASADGALATKWANRLADHYARLGEMVPEWRDETDTTLVDAIVDTIATGEFAATRRAVDRLNADCRSCHRQYQALAALRYRWPGFDGIRVPDPTGGSIPHSEFKRSLSITLNRIKIAAEDQRWRAARDAAGQLAAQFDNLGETCGNCHDDPEPSERFLGATLRESLGKLDIALDARDARGVGRRLGGMAVHSCSRCHAVHRLLSQAQRYLFDN